VRGAKFTLYHDAALRSVRVRWLLHELVGDDFEVEYVDTYRGEQYGAKFLAINPNHCVPVLKITLENGQSMHMLESAAMVALLADAFPEKGLAPAPVGLSLARADYMQVLHSGASIDMMLWQVRIHEQVLPDDEKDVRTVRRYKRKFATEMEPQLRSRLKQTSFICGDRFSAADCIIAHCIMWARMYELCVGEPFDSYLGRLAERPAYCSAFSDLHRFVREVPKDSPVVAMFTG
jgi:glutathione S-transferase